MRRSWPYGLTSARLRAPLACPLAFWVCNVTLCAVTLAVLQSTKLRYRPLIAWLMEPFTNGVIQNIERSI